jgi:hypothetical protein
VARIQDLLCAATRRGIENPAFAVHFADVASIRRQWPVTTHVGQLRRNVELWGSQAFYDGHAAFAAARTIVITCAPASTETLSVPSETSIKRRSVKSKACCCERLTRRNRRRTDAGRGPDRQRPPR